MTCLQPNNDHESISRDANDRSFVLPIDNIFFSRYKVGQKLFIKDFKKPNMLVFAGTQIL